LPGECNKKVALKGKNKYYISFNINGLQNLAEESFLKKIISSFFYKKNGV